MRLLLLSLLFVVGYLRPAQAQQGEPIPVPTREEYLRKSKHQRQAANVMLLMGSGVAVTSAVGVASALQTSTANPSYQTWENTMIVGLGVAFASLPLYIASHHNRRRAEQAVSLHLEALPIRLRPENMASLHPAIGLRLTL